MTSDGQRLGGGVGSFRRGIIVKNEVAGSWFLSPRGYTHIARISVCKILETLGFFFRNILGTRHMPTAAKTYIFTCTDLVLVVWISKERKSNTLDWPILPSSVRVFPVVSQTSCAGEHPTGLVASMGGGRVVAEVVGGDTYRRKGEISDHIEGHR